MVDYFQALTKDSVTVTVDAVVYYSIKEPLNAVVKVTNYRYNNFSFKKRNMFTIFCILVIQRDY